jgi:hypothetical protein
VAWDPWPEKLAAVPFFLLLLLLLLLILLPCR